MVAPRPERRSRAPEPAVRLAGGAEFDLIRRFFERRPAGSAGEESAGARATRPDLPAGALVGAGDDCAVVTGDGIAVGTDLSVEGVHFRREWLRPEEIGYRAATAALSDLAAMAARPIGVLASLLLPERDVPETAVALMAGVHQATVDVDAAVLGGDVAASPAQLAVDIVVLGEVAEPILRAGAEAGDELWVTGELGGAGAAVAWWERGEDPSAEARERFARPHARTKEAIWLAERTIPAALIDLSDGLLGDAAHLAAAGGVAVVLERSAVPVSSAALAALDDRDRAIELAISAGEDYELLFAARPGAGQAVAREFEDRFGLPLYRVGKIEEGSGVYVQDPNGGRQRRSAGGYRHFAEGGR